LSSDLTNKILFLINDKKPRSVEELSEMMKQEYDITENEIIISILKLHANGSIEFRNPKVENSFRAYSVGNETVWYWVTIGIGFFAALLFFTISETAYPLIYLRNFMGLFLVLFLPGYVFVRILFPINVMTKTQHKQIETIQRVALSIGISAVIVTIIGLLVYYSPWGLDLSPIVLSLFVLTSVLATAALFKEYRIKKVSSETS